MDDEDDDDYDGDYDGDGSDDETSSERNLKKCVVVAALDILAVRFGAALLNVPRASGGQVVEHGLVTAGKRDSYVGDDS